MSSIGEQSDLILNFKIKSDFIFSEGASDFDLLS